MAVGKFMKSSGVVALAATLAALAIPAQAQERGGWSNRGGNGGGAAASSGPSWRGNGSGSNNGSSWRGGDGNSRSVRSEPSSGTATPQAQPRPQRNWSRGESSPQGSVGQGGASRWQGRGDGDGRWNGMRNRPADQAQAVPARPQTEAQAGSRRPAWSGNGQWQNRNRDGDDRTRPNPAWRGDNDRRNDGNTNRWRNDSDRRGDAWRNNGWNNWRGDRQNLARNWNRDWRRDDRYDWRGYRNTNRSVFRLGAYAAPYRNYSYRRLNSGFYLDTMFFGSRYWINDPWQYRLPPADGPFRWIRYYDDALLVDTYSGEVVDVIYDFFW